MEDWTRSSPKRAKIKPSFQWENPLETGMLGIEIRNIFNGKSNLVHGVVLNSKHFDQRYRVCQTSHGHDPSTRNARETMFS